MVKEGTLPFKFDAARPARFGVLPRDATSAEGIRWFSTKVGVKGLLVFFVGGVVLLLLLVNKRGHLLASWCSAKVGVQLLVFVLVGAGVEEFCCCCSICW